MAFDPEGPVLSNSLFGLPHQPHEAKVAVFPVPFDATTSYRRGTAGAPAAVRLASGQVDLWDNEVGTPWKAGIVMWEVDENIVALNRKACVDVEFSRDPGQVGFDASVCEAAIIRVNEAGAELNTIIGTFVADRLAAGQIPAVLGGDHSVAFAAIQAASRRFPGLGVLHIDAHADLRRAYEGFTWSHASLIYNVLSQCDVGRIVQVGVRDQSASENETARQEARIVQWPDQALAMALARGRLWSSLVEDIIAPLPKDIWVTFDIDGLDPSLCPGTGTPVPGGLLWREAMLLLGASAQSGRRIVGFDICEIGNTQWDAIVGARLLYKLAGWAILAQGGEQN